jgi:hypothetical protein
MSKVDLPKKSFRVWIAQVNQTYVDVKAADRDDAVEKAQRKWKREFVGARVLDVREES